MDMARSSACISSKHIRKCGFHLLESGITKPADNCTEQPQIDNVSEIRITLPKHAIAGYLYCEQHGIKSHDRPCRRRDLVSRIKHRTAKHERRSAKLHQRGNIADKNAQRGEKPSHTATKHHYR